MPTIKNLENVHQELMEIAKESSKLSHTKYTSDDVEKLQNKLRDIDSQYSQGCFTQSQYEEQGLAQVSDELERVHTTLHRMLSRLD
jgi:lipid II:glycine glycyltransferase (peptidoglycan interpeptide bridge formation enzyme)